MGANLSFARAAFSALGVIVLTTITSCSLTDAPGISPAGLEPTLGFQLVDGGRVAMQSGQPVPSFGRQPRPRLDLSTGWRFQAANLNDDMSFAPRSQSLGGLVREAAGREKPGFDDSAWQVATVPGSVNPPPRGLVTDGWYRVTFTPSADWLGDAVTLKFGRVNYLADVWLNGTYLGYHEGGWTPFAFDAQKALITGAPNVLAVRFVDPQRGTRLDVVPWGLADSWDYAGITGPVWLEASDVLHVVRADVVPHLDAADVSVVIQNSGDQPINDATITVEVLPAAVTDANLLDPDPLSLVEPVAEPVAVLTIDGLSIGAGTVIQRDGSFVFRNADSWSMDKPSLYALGVLVSSGGVVRDNYYDTFGLRRIQVDPNAPRLLLNGTPIAFTGVAVHDEKVSPPVKGQPAGGTPPSAEDELQQVRHAQSVNADLLRTNHVPGDPALLMLADRLGQAVWEEIPLNHYTPETFTLVMRRGLPQQMLAEMALRDMNRPSVMFHGFANESTGVDERMSAMKTLRDLDRKIDGTRLTGQAMYGSNPTDPTSSPLDVAGYTFYYGVFYGGQSPEPGTSHALELAHQTYPHKPIMILEFGDWVFENSGDRQQQNLFRGTYPALATHFDTLPDGYLGSAVWWSLEDYWTDVPGVTVEHFGLYRPDGSERPVAGDARVGFGSVTVPAAPVVGLPSRGSGVAAPTPTAGRLWLYLGYAVVVPAVPLATITFGLLWLRRRRVSARRLNLEVSS
ncbi:MAG TPA: glycoside hydrolase family 2 TIM barrel-domain containing protein [Candidatus Dormibacteraeota bacterium]|nr:glycoside hydrolase family 2 TIM barrel-domain containing protein [Candidatus Dormibacteraeota bacterium]